MARTQNRWKGPTKFWAARLDLVADTPQTIQFPIAVDRVFVTTAAAGNNPLMYVTSNDGSVMPVFPTAGMSPALLNGGMGIRVIAPGAQVPPLEVNGGAAYWTFMTNVTMTLYLEGGQAAFANE